MRCPAFSAVLVGALCVVACSSGADVPGKTSAPTYDDSVDVFDVPISGLPADLLRGFNDGDAAFSTPVREADGLGPLYTRVSCDSCHAQALRGPGLVQKMSVVEADGVTPSADQSKLVWGHTVRPLTAGGATTPVLPPAGDPSVKVTTRVGPPLLGRGYMEAIADDEIKRVEAEQASRADGIHGRINSVVYASGPIDDSLFETATKGDVLIGRFGLKARIATLDDFVADAFQGDMGITSSMRPVEVPNPDGLLDDAKPGPDVIDERVTLRAMYVRLLAIPKRVTTPDGAALFDQTLCGACHVPSLKTRGDYPVPDLAAIDAPVYTDLLLHSMGDALADGLPAGADVDGQAGSHDFRTAPLIGLRFLRTFLHDGRAHSIEEAIELHRGAGSEANPAVDRFDALPLTDRQQLLDFVGAL